MSDDFGIGTRLYFALLIVAVASAAHEAVFAQSPGESSSKQADEKPDVSASDSSFWTCPMHPQVRQAADGKCPICGMALVEAGKTPTDELTGPLGLQEMLSIALKNNPDVRAADANLRSAEAELDRTRLAVVQKIIAFREKWQAQRVTVYTAELELTEATRQKKLAEQGAIPSKRINVLIESATEKLEFEQAKLAELEAELPYLLGTEPGKPIAQPDDKSVALIREKLLPTARQILQIRTRAYQTGEASILDVAAAHREVAELETRAAQTRRQKVAALENQKKVLQDIRNIADALYKSNNASQADVLAADLELSKLELRILELKGD